MSENHAAPDWDLLSSYAGLLTLALGSIYSGAHGSLSPVKHKPRGDVRPSISDDEDEEEEVEDRLSSADAYLFPVLGSVILLGLYLIIKYVGREWLNWLMQWYFTIAGVGSVSKSVIALVRWTVGPSRWKQFHRHRILYTRHGKELFSLSWRTPSLYLIPLGALPSIIYTLGPQTSGRSALITDILALSFAHNALSILKLDSFKTGCVLLSGLFAYDIWWVFGTEVMVKVATNLDVPIKLLWAKSLTFNTDRGFTMLGLGDVVIPGMFVCLALRYDQHRATPKSRSEKFSTPYFFAALFGYTLGLTTTIFVMHTYKKAQPALLYLSPGCILSFVFTALSRGEFQDAWAWSDEPQGSKANESHEAVKNGHAKGAFEAADTNGNVLIPTNGLAQPKEGRQLSDVDDQVQNEERQKRSKHESKIKKA